MLSETKTKNTRKNLYWQKYKSTTCAAVGKTNAHFLHNAFCPTYYHFFIISSTRSAYTQFWSKPATAADSQCRWAAAVTPRLVTRTKLLLRIILHCANYAVIPTQTERKSGVNTTADFEWATREQTSVLYSLWSRVVHTDVQREPAYQQIDLRHTATWPHEYHCGTWSMACGWWYKLVTQL